MTEPHEQREVLARCLRFLADLNGANWIPGNGAGEVDMRQRAKALQELAFVALNKSGAAQ
jgi:hypothetical protein